MRYIATVIHSNNSESEHAYEAHTEQELRQYLEKKGLKIKDIRLDGSLEIDDLRASLKIYSKLIGLLVLFLTAAFLFSFPFPFIRKIWFEEIWGYFGLLNIFAFMIIAVNLPKMSVTAIFSGFALVLYEQCLTGVGFYYFFKRGEITNPILLFSIFVTFLSLGLLTLFWKAFQITRTYYGVIKIVKEQHHIDSGETFSWQRYLMRFGIFTLYFAAPLIFMNLSPAMDNPKQLAAMRILGECVLLIAASGVGFEVKRCFKNRVWSLHSIGIIVFHVLALLILGRWIYLQTPLEAVYLSGARQIPF